MVGQVHLANFVIAGFVDKDIKKIFLYHRHSNYIFKIRPAFKDRVGPYSSYEQRRKGKLVRRRRRVQNFKTKQDFSSKKPFQDVRKREQCLIKLLLEIFFCAPSFCRFTFDRFQLETMMTSNFEPGLGPNKLPNKLLEPLRPSFS